MKNKPTAYCEPFCIKDGYNFEIHHVQYAEQSDDYSCFMHFHEVHELIFFEKIEGSFYYHQGESELKNYDIVFTPAMETHDFELTAKAKSWFIVQFPAKIFQLEALKHEADFFQSGMHLRVDENVQIQLMQILRWLHTSFLENPHSNKSFSLLKLAIIILAEQSQPRAPSSGRPISSTASFDKIKPIIELFRHQPSVNMTLEEAAALCHVSPSYFSRLFKSVFRYSYTEYSVRHKLYSAARMLGQSNKPITDISYELYFSSPSYFISLFKKQFGCTPKKYRTDIMSRIESDTKKHPK